MRAFSRSRCATSITPALQLAFFVGIISLALTLGGAVPSVLWLMNRGQLRLSRLLVFGTLIGNVPFASIVGVTILATLGDRSFSASVARLWYGAEGAFRFVLIGTVHGVVAAVVFWFCCDPRQRTGNNPILILSDLRPGRHSFFSM